MKRRLFYLKCLFVNSIFRINSSLGICEIHRRGNQLICNVSQQFYFSLDENEFILHNVCMNTSDSHQFSTKSDENGNETPKADLKP